jgi:glycine oxidase (EC 1.4.3.19)
MKLQPSSIVILGAGLMGRLLAVELARQGHTVEVFDSGGPAAEHAAAPIAAAMVAPLAESAVTEPGVVRMGQYSLTRWPQVLAALEQPVFFQQDGTLIVWHRQDAAEAHRLQRLLETTQTTIPDLPAMQVLDSAGVAAAEPTLAHRFTQGLYLPGEGQLDNRQLLGRPGP